MQIFSQLPKHHRFSHGGSLRKERAGRGARKLSTKHYLHVVFKANKMKIRSRSLRSSRYFKLIHEVIKQYSRRFSVKIVQMSIQNDHIHILVRTHRRSKYLYFFRVVAGQIAQRFGNEGFFVTDTLAAPGTAVGARAKSGARGVTGTPGEGGEGSTGLWRFRPFSRVVVGWRDYRTVRNYIQLNEQEARGVILYSKERLRGLQWWEWNVLWS